MLSFVVASIFLCAGTSDPAKRDESKRHHNIGGKKTQEYDYLRMPTHGSVYKGMLYGYLDDKGVDTISGRGPRELNGIALSNTARASWKVYPLQLAGKNLRHHIGYGALWFSNSTGFLNSWNFDNIQEIADSILKPTDALGRNMIVSGISLLKLMEKHQAPRRRRSIMYQLRDIRAKRFFSEKRIKKSRFGNRKERCFRRLVCQTTPQCW